MKVRARRAYALLEAALWLTGMAIVLFFSGALLVSGMRLKATTEESSKNLFLLRNLADGFRQDVHTASAVLERTLVGKEELVESENCLILQKPDNHVVVYRWRNGKLDRLEQGGVNPTAWNVPLDTDIKWLELGHDKGTPPLVTLRVRLQASKVSVNKKMEFQASLGGEL